MKMNHYEAVGVQAVNWATSANGSKVAKYLAAGVGTLIVGFAAIAGLGLLISTIA